MTIAYNQNCGNMLIVCNKIDALPDELAGISPKTMVKKRLEVPHSRITDAPRMPASESFAQLWRHGDATCSVKATRSQAYKHTTQTEIEALRRARAEGLDDIANSMRVELEIAGFALHSCSVHDAVFHLRSCVYVVARAREGRDAQTRERARARESERESERERERERERARAREREIAL
jgi:hypothetical protein